jgi:uncharacterized membrane protein
MRRLHKNFVSKFILCLYLLLIINNELLIGYYLYMNDLTKVLLFTIIFLFLVYQWKTIRNVITYEEN